MGIRLTINVELDKLPPTHTVADMLRLEAQTMDIRAAAGLDEITDPGLLCSGELSIGHGVDEIVVGQIETSPMPVAYGTIMPGNQRIKGLVDLYSWIDVKRAAGQKITAEWLLTRLDQMR